MAPSKSSRPAWLLPLGVVLFVVPLLLSLAWGAYFSDAAYHTFQVARQIAACDFQSATCDLQPTLGRVTQAPLYLALLAPGGRAIPQIALVIGALGWGATAVLILLFLRAVGRPTAAVIASLLLVISPLIILTAGSETSWVLALGWAALALSTAPASPRWASPTAVWLKSLLLLLLLGLHFDVSTILFALALLALDVYQGRAGWWPFIVTAGAALLWGNIMIPRYGVAAGDLRLWLQESTALLLDRQLYWLFVPFVLAGLWDLWTWETTGDRLAPGQMRQKHGRQQLALLLLWAVTAAVASSALAAPVVSVTAIVLAGLGVTWFARTIRASGRFESDPQQSPLFLPVLLMTPLALAALVSLWQLYAAQPVQQAALQEQAAIWLQENTGPEATLYAPPRVGFLSERATIPAMVNGIRDHNIDDVYALLLGHVPDIVVSENTFAWDYITRTTWFQDRYQVRATFQNGYASDSPVTIWEYTPTPFDEGDQEALYALVNDTFALVGYRFEPQTITPGEDVYLTLYLQPLKPFENGFTTVVHLSAADDGWVWAWREEWTPRSFPGEWWVPGQVIPERILLPTTEDLPLGAYDLQVFWRAGDERHEHWPVIRDEDESVLDRVFLGYVNAPPLADTSRAMPVGAKFSDTIVLDSYELAPAVPGEAWDVTLYWEALSPPPQDYTVFLHLVDADGQVVAAHDGMPANNRFPTRAWKPEQIIADTHTLFLPADLAPGTYQVNVGLYLLETGERLPVVDAAGVEQAGRSLPLATIAIRDEPTAD